jgi:hypothetical protein
MGTEELDVVDLVDELADVTTAHFRTDEASRTGLFNVLLRPSTEEKAKFVKFVIVLCSFFWMAGCDKPSDEADVPAGVTGYVFEINPIVVVPDPTDAPEGAKPVSDAQVSLVRFDETIASIRTDGDGSFTIFENASGTYRLEIRKTPSAATPDKVIPISLVADTMLRVGVTPQVSREEAVEAVLELASPTALVACVQNPLPAGTKVEPTFGPPSDEIDPADVQHVVGANGQWFCINDENQFDDFGHELEYLFVDAQTAQVKRMPGQIWWPRINGLVMWTYWGDLFYSSDPSMTPDAIATAGEFPDEVNLYVSDDVVRIGERDENDSFELELDELFAESTGLHTKYSDIIALVWVGTPEQRFILNGDRVYKWLVKQGVPTENIFRMQYAGGVAGRPLKGFFSGVFSSPSRETLIGATKKVLDKMKAALKTKAESGRHPAVFVYAASHGDKNGNFLVVDQGLRSAIRKLTKRKNFMIPAEEILPLHDLEPFCKLRVVVQTCFSGYHAGRWMKKFTKESDDVQIFTSSGNSLSSAKSMWTAIQEEGGSGFYRGIVSLSQSDKKKIGSSYTTLFSKRAKLSPAGELTVGWKSTKFPIITTAKSKYKVPPATNNPQCVTLTPSAPLCTEDASSRPDPQNAATGDFGLDDTNPAGDMGSSDDLGDDTGERPCDPDGNGTAPSWYAGLAEGEVCKPMYDKVYGRDGENLLCTTDADCNNPCRMLCCGAANRLERIVCSDGICTFDWSDKCGGPCDPDPAAGCNLPPDL